MRPDKMHLAFVIGSHFYSAQARQDRVRRSVPAAYMVMLAFFAQRFIFAFLVFIRMPAVPAPAARIAAVVMMILLPFISSSLV